MTDGPPPAAPGATDSDAPLLDVENLAVSFDVGGDRPVQAVDGVSFTVHRNQMLAVVGESGCGKSVTAMSVLRLLPRPPANYDRGVIRFGARDLLQVPDREMLQIRGGEIAMIFQEPMTSLNPVFTIGDQITEAILLHQAGSSRDARQIAVEAMREVGIPEPERRINAYPHEFSGGMRQRVMIAMALACRPRLLLADEPTTALDVTIQAQILALLRRLQREREMGVVFITHDLGVVAENADVVCVMYAGRVVEYAAVETLFARPMHPYTRGLLSSIPRLDQRRDRLTTVADVVNNEAEFTRLPDSLRPWWPTHTRPADASPDGDGVDSVTAEVEPEHWVGCWRTPAALEHAGRRPSLTHRRPADASESGAA